MKKGVLYPVYIVEFDINLTKYVKNFFCYHIQSTALSFEKSIFI